MAAADFELEHREVFASALALGGGMSLGELRAVHHLVGSVREGATIVQLGCWRGASFIVALDALREMTATFVAVDCFDLPGVAEQGGMSPVTVNDFKRNIQPYVREQHTVEIIRTDTLALRGLPMADVILVDACHQLKHVLHDATLAKLFVSPNGTIVFHDYGFSDWPDVKVAVDFLFERNIVAVHERLACIRLGAPSLVPERDASSLLF